MVDAVDTQDLPEVPTRFQSTTTIRMTQDKLLALYPGHIAGKGRGFGHFGGNNSHIFRYFLSQGDPRVIKNFVESSSIPPNKNEPMVDYRTTF